MMFTIFTAWGYEVSALELSAVITSFTAVLLGARGVRMTWPWYLLSASLYALFFYQVDLIASALLQFVFIAAAIWGWLGWKKSGVLPRYMNNKERLIWLSALITSWLITAPALENIGAAATLPDSFLLISSTLAQAAMVLQRNETWIAWIVIDIFGTYHYANQGYWFTALLYGVFTVIAFFGLKRWKKLSSSANPI
ncbi:MAG: nicotinamide mononucleotide transporter [Actinobacteria bacterium BACL2 MAG-121001-bin67]|jgi:nicotinamide mononucleotide transporter|uniref:Nicotinamide mononucleotide transporter n=4 Tax=ac1 cluster TaxID=1655545 RepID=A0A0R2P3J1_9ACTN|nr:MAG: nicotinamide mononucleotide transporter [Actinobacteria bacterium BACL2 MAG-121001-bin67]KRO44779.1 MAG: nicotinamide mononucleotide transporter [Actinobacteria bacterium BACL2 MAG-120813-bin23]KRO54045.1 MAG: nicotinamide mononucleotide transporter [Actinobacteria bacterium BACL2 MAG-120820-bin50]KRO74295.1 MAG: nicotinamide mononucleotide transporter [Actinobacteria bacterium BACL2 MAG-120920-bin34]MDP4614817.1 nicotinamide riboside transporter PnuC [Candidatus Nanopelagicales bacteri